MISVRQSPGRLSREVYLRFQRIFRCLDFGRSLGGKPPTLTGAQMRVLSFFNEKDVVHISDISRTLGMSLQSVNNIISRLETHGIVCRSPNLRDRRMSDICLTEKGLQGLTKFRQEQIGSLDELLGRISREDRRRLISALEQVAGILETAVHAGSHIAEDDGHVQEVD